MSGPLVDGARVIDLDAAIEAYGVRRLTMRRPPGGAWVALAVTPRHVEAVGAGSTLEAALIDLFRDVARLDAERVSS